MAEVIADRQASGSKNGATPTASDVDATVDLPVEEGVSFC
jgi:hypothetical protein